MLRLLQESSVTSLTNIAAVKSMFCAAVIQGFGFCDARNQKCNVVLLRVRLARNLLIMAGGGGPSRKLGSCPSTLRSPATIAGDVAIQTKHSIPDPVVWAMESNHLLQHTSDSCPARVATPPSPLNASKSSEANGQNFRN